MEKNNIYADSISNSIEIFVQNKHPTEVFFKFMNFCYEKYRISNSSHKLSFKNLNYSDIKSNKQIDDFFKLCLIFIQVQKHYKNHQNGQKVNRVIFENVFDENNEDFIGFINNVNQTLQNVQKAQCYQDFSMTYYQSSDDEISDENLDQEISQEFEIIDYEDLIKYQFTEKWPQKKI
ncbi:unnamed protein product (macronuclear) [Paramecium tetraurelia]|uniref:Uncharacterized protein n=1 Tax=Paramecium tetraurelia TaxID=5888 RepID=A0E8R7_PARTE|nr:uncharacterized protein GSPATT00024413001 [Paramecium tetraurelia]CAK91684.1 unnamed protein product [Paramecium tetraurelia]|eukprot:XP_001459081.1 hypothetical protein (macronuclear) [Paramecium tetraurelia strain d4-2]